MIPTYLLPLSIKSHVIIPWHSPKKLKGELFKQTKFVTSVIVHIYNKSQIQQFMTPHKFVYTPWICAYTSFKMYLRLFKQQLYYIHLSHDRLFRLMAFWFFSLFSIFHCIFQSYICFSARSSSITSFRRFLSRPFFVLPAGILFSFMIHSF